LLCRKLVLLSMQERTGRVGILLLFDRHHTISAVKEPLAPVPFVRLLAIMSIEHVRNGLEGFGGDFWSMRALREEMRQVMGHVPAEAPYPRSLISAVSRAIARGTIRVAIELPAAVSICFEQTRTCGHHGFDTVVFPSLPIALRTMAEPLKDDANAAAFAAALAASEAARYQEMIVGGADLPGRIAPLLAAQHLLLQPNDLSRQRFRLLWNRRQATSVAAKAGLPPDLSPPPRTPRAAPRSRLTDALPDLPIGTSPQVQALVDAARNGAPFCEQCARRAAEMADA
jgi:hypothetical protein